MTDVNGPPEPPTGQEGELPDLLLVLKVTNTLLTDVKPVLVEPEHHDLLLRLLAVRSVVQRLRHHMEHQT